MKRVCVIGAGASGLPAIKCCLDENIIPVCYERSQDLGGLWRYDHEKTEGASIYKSTILNTAKEVVSYSDFVMPKEFANYMHHTNVLEYMRAYAKQFNLLKHIEFNTEVLKCEYAEDYDETGRWKVTIKNRRSGVVNSEHFDGILVCIGHHAIPHFPTQSFPGFDKFKGEAMHSNDYREPVRFSGKKVVVIGAANSGGDIAVELGNHADKVFLSTRRGSWVMSRLLGNGVPIAYGLMKRSTSLLQSMLPLWWTNATFEKELNRKFDHAMYGMKPEHKALSQHPLVNDHLPYSIISGLVTVKGNVKEFTEQGVIFEDGSEEEVDVVVFSTGYKIAFSFLDESILKVRENVLRLFRFVWPPNLKHGSLAIIGCTQALGGLLPASEMQCRWATRVINGDAKLPAREKMEKIIDDRFQKNQKRFYKSPRHTLEADYIPFMDAVADEIGVKPDLWKLFKEDFELAWKVFFKPCTSFQYRLMGPGAWPGARNAIMTQGERMRFPLATRRVKPDKGLRWWRFVVVSLIVLILAYLIF